MLIGMLGPHTFRGTVTEGLNKMHSWNLPQTYSKCMVAVHTVTCINTNHESIHVMSVCLSSTFCLPDPCAGLSAWLQVPLNLVVDTLKVCATASTDIIGY